MSGTAIPDVLPASALPADAERYDVVVVGFGIAGGCAAVSAAARMRRLDRADGAFVEVMDEP